MGKPSEDLKEPVDEVKCVLLILRKFLALLSGDLVYCQNDMLSVDLHSRGLSRM